MYLDFVVCMLYVARLPLLDYSTEFQTFVVAGEGAGCAIRSRYLRVYLTSVLVVSLTTW